MFFCFSRGRKCYQKNLKTFLCFFFVLFLFFFLCNEMKLINFYSFLPSGFIMLCACSREHIKLPLLLVVVVVWLERFFFHLQKLNYYSLKILIVRHILLLRLLATLVRSLALLRFLIVKGTKITQQNANYEGGRHLSGKRLLIIHHNVGACSLPFIFERRKTSYKRWSDDPYHQHPHGMNKFPFPCCGGKFIFLSVMNYTILNN